MINRLSIFFYYHEELDDDLNTVSRGKSGFTFHSLGNFLHTEPATNAAEVNKIKDVLFNPNIPNLKWQILVNSYIGNNVRLSKTIAAYLDEEIKTILINRLEFLSRVHDATRFQLKKRKSKSYEVFFKKKQLTEFDSYLNGLRESVDKGDFDLFYMNDWYKVKGAIYFRKADEYNLNDSEPSATNSSPIFLSKARGKKIDLIRIVTAMYELKFFTKENSRPTKKEIMEAFGTFLNADLSNYDVDFSNAVNNRSTETNVKIFSDLAKKISEICSKK